MSIILLYNGWLKANGTVVEEKATSKALFQLYELEFKQNGSNKIQACPRTQMVQR